MWDCDPCSGCFHEMRSAFIEVRAIVEDLNARRQRGEQPENKCYESAFYRWHKAIAALAECVGCRKPAAVGQPRLTDSPTQVRFGRLKQSLLGVALVGQAPAQNR